MKVPMFKSSEWRVVKAVTLREHINEHYDGNVSAFARAVGKEPQNVHYALRNGFIVVNDDMVFMASPSYKLPPVGGDK